MAHVWIYLVDFSNPQRYVLRFEGWVTGSISYDAGSITFQVGSILDKLNDVFPKIVYSTTCNHSLFDSYCGLNKEGYKVNGNVQAGSTEKIIYNSVIFEDGAYPLGYFTKGELKMTSGPNYNISRSIMVHGNGYVKLLTPLPNSVSPGETFTVYPGCDGKGETCDNIFSNYENFLGFEYIPNPKVLMG
jgi:uncharacterized phage protein (TIGR02218 family)